MASILNSLRPSPKPKKPKPQQVIANYIVQGKTNRVKRALNQNPAIDAQVFFFF